MTNCGCGCFFHDHVITPEVPSSAMSSMEESHDALETTRDGVLSSSGPRKKPLALNGWLWTPSDEMFAPLGVSLATSKTDGITSMTQLQTQLPLPMTSFERYKMQLRLYCHSVSSHVRNSIIVFTATHRAALHKNIVSDMNGMYMLLIIIL